MQQFDAWHFLAAFGDLDAVPNEHVPAVDAQRLRKEAQGNLRPEPREPIQMHTSAVEMLAERGVEPRMELERSNDTGNAQQIGAHGQSGDDNGEPDEGLRA